MSKFLSHIIVALMVSLFWLYPLIREHDMRLNTLRQNDSSEQEISNLKQELFKMDSRLNDASLKTESLENEEFKLNLIRELEERRNVRVSVKVIDAIYQASIETEYDLAFLLAWADVETSLQANPKPYRPVKGILQVNYAVWKNELELEESLMGDPYYNILKGIDVLEIYKDMANGDVDHALFLYNNGPSGKYKNTKYVPKILHRQKIYSEIIKDLKQL